MKLSIIIPTKNEGKNLPRLLTSLKNQNFSDFEIIVVDNHSSDKTVAIAKKYTKKVYNAGSERSSQRNFGAKEAFGKYLLFLDADMELGPRILEECYQKMENDGQLAGIVIDEVSVGTGILAKVKALEKKIYTGVGAMEAARFFKREDFQKIGGFDEELIAGEDWDLSQRMEKLGKLGRVSGKILHHEENSLVEDLKKKYYYAQNIRKYQKKHPGIWGTQAGFVNRLLILFAKPQLILFHPFEFFVLILLKSAQFLAYVVVNLRGVKKSKFSL